MKAFLFSISIILLLTPNLFFIYLPSEDKDFFGYNYFPFNVNKKIIYNSDFGETTTTVTGDGDGYIIKNMSEDFSYIQKFLKKDDGIFLIGTEQHLEAAIFLSSDAIISYSEPALYIPMPMTIGREWYWTGFQFDGDEKNRIKITGKVICEEKIKLPEGDHNTIRIVLNIKVDDGLESIITEWLAPELGIVKANIKTQRSGIVGFFTSLLGYSEIDFELREIVD